MEAKFPEKGVVVFDIWAIIDAKKRVALGTSGGAAACSYRETYHADCIQHAVHTLVRVTCEDNGPFPCGMGCFKDAESIETKIWLVLGRSGNYVVGVTEKQAEQAYAAMAEVMGWGKPARTIQVIANLPLPQPLTLMAAFSGREGGVFIATRS